MQPLHTETAGQYRIKIYIDSDPMNPRVENDNLGTIYHTHRNYDLGVKMDLDQIQDIVNDDSYVTVPVYIYEHGNVMLSTGSFGCQWDSGQVGIIAVKKIDAMKAWNRKKWSKSLEQKVINCLKGEINEFSSYLSGNVYGYVIEKTTHCDACEHNDAVEADSCWGFVGDMEYCLNEARGNVPKDEAA